VYSVHQLAEEITDDQNDAAARAQRAVRPHLHPRGARPGLPEAALEASAVADPHATVKADVERLLTSPLLAPKVSVSGHVYDIATGRVTTVVDARYP
jgi:carbonic anhydrase